MRTAVVAVAGAVLLGSALPRGAMGQAPAERLRLDSLRARYDTVADSVRLLAVEQARINVARHDRDNPFIHMELGWIAQRIGDLTGTKSHYDDAAGEFEWASDLQPQWAYAWYWLGVSELSLGESNFIALENIRQALGLDYLSRAARDFARAIEVDPSFTSALVELANTTLRQRVRGRVDVALQALRNATATAAGRTPAIWLLLGRLERRVGDNDSARIDFGQFLALGGDPQVGNVEVSRAEAALGMRDSALAAYQAALASPLTDSGRAEVRRDLRWIGSPRELAAFDAAPPESLAAVVNRFWSARDVEDARVPGDRLLEQFRRYAYATQNFQLVSRHRGFNVEFMLHDTTQTELDDRGVIYMRQGAPTSVVHYIPPGSDAEPSETWYYRRDPPAQDLIFNFAPLGNIQDYRLVESLAQVCVQGRGAPERTLVENQPGAVDPQCFGARAAFSDVYARLQQLIPGSASYQSLLASERQLLDRSERTGTTTDAYPIAFAGDLRPVISTFIVGDTLRRPELHVVFAVPANRLHPVSVASGALYPLRLRILVYDTSDRAVAALDTLRTFHAPAVLAGDAFLTEQMTLRVPPGAWRTHIIVEEAASDNGTIVRAYPIDVPRMDGGFAVSDIVVGREGSGLVWHRPGEQGDIPLNPLARFPVGGTATLYYEMYGLPAGTSVPTRVTVRPVGGGGLLAKLFGHHGGAELAYTTVTDQAGRARVRQQVGLVGLKPGRYTIEVTLTDPATGRHVERHDRLEIDGRAP